MAMKYFCDRCNKEINDFFDSERVFVLPISVRKSHIMEIQKINHINIDSKRFELCVDCLEELINWVKSKENK